MKVKNIYLFGCSDDCMELATDFGVSAESYVGITINKIRAHYVYDGDWGIWLEGEVPSTWTVFSVDCNMASDVRGKPHAGAFIHIQVPDHEAITVIEHGDEEQQ